MPKTGDTFLIQRRRLDYVQNRAEGIPDRYGSPRAFGEELCQRQRFLGIVEIERDHRELLCAGSHGDEFGLAHFGGCKPGE